MFVYKYITYSFPTKTYDTFTPSSFSKFIFNKPSLLTNNVLDFDSLLANSISLNSSIGNFTGSPNTTVLIAGI